MGLISHLFWPWGMFVQLAALVHFFRRRPEWYWFYIILIGGALGSVIYIFAEVVPDFDLARASIQRYGRGSRVATAEATVRENPSVANLEDLGELYWDQRRYAKAREAFDRAIATRADAPRTFYLRGQCEMQLRDFPLRSATSSSPFAATRKWTVTAANFFWPNLMPPSAATRMPPPGSLTW